MRKLASLGLMFLLLILGACSNNTNSDALEGAPEYIKETWKYFNAMSKVTDAVGDGENVEVAYDKYFPNEDEVISYIDSATAESEEEQLVIDNIHLMHLSVSTMYIADFNSSLGGDPADIDQFVYELQVPRHELGKIYKKYGLEYKK
ncbi:hypothetical protein [Neobacillus sp. OS1-33]|uniref:hypothetical protein n=1 Tax=Neobacillus sp. OS1-33 TaxID=3070683 RepID=UPI0027E1B1B5|nr:hypothetical protein [Neobacillus sp. OS1-33]WML25659.1 hypothetical protein RCG22_23005 [Neobacillus sp. OS1-33]